MPYSSNRHLPSALHSAKIYKCILAFVCAPPFPSLLLVIHFKTRQKSDRFLTEAKKSGKNRGLLYKCKQVKARTSLLGANAYAFKDIDVSTTLNMTYYE